MALQMFLDDAKTVALQQENIFYGPGTTFNLIGLTNTDVSAVYKWDAAQYVALTAGTQYNVTGIVLTLTTALSASQHVVVIPTNHLDLIFTGTEGSSRTQTQKLVFHKSDATTVYDALNIYSENLTADPAMVYDLTDTIAGLDMGTYDITVEAMIYRNAPPYSGVGAVVGVGFVTNLDISAAMLEDCAVIINGVYIGDVWATDPANMIIVLPTGTTFPGLNGIADIVQIVSTGSLKFALGAFGDVEPAAEAFKRCLTIPTLTLANPTEYVWMKQTTLIPTNTTITPNMPFKLIGQTYAE